MTDPAEIEATAEPTIDVEFRGQTYTFPASLEDADGDVIDAVDNQKLSHALQGLLDVDQWKRFKATKPKVRDYAALFDVYAEKIGLGKAAS